MRAAITGRGGEAVGEQVVGLRRGRAGVGAGRAVVHVIVFGGEQEIAAGLVVHHRVGLGRALRAALRHFGTAATGDHGAAVAVVGLRVQVAVVDRVRERAGGDRGAL